MRLAELNALGDEAARDAFGACLQSPLWVATMVSSRPFTCGADLVEAAESACRDLPLDEWRAAIAHHARIGEPGATPGRSERAALWAADEQSGAQHTDEATAAALGAANGEYERRFGHRFIICATGMSAAEMLDALRTRLPNDTFVELLVAAGEVRKIAMLRIAKLVPGS
jgi:2-oxo-4-hydroxy-4-carboxy-5-ureidoimidazoline decarboxylase